MMIKLAVFDMDGTIFESYLDWLKIREELNIPQGVSILQEIYKDGKVDNVRLGMLESYEKENTLKTKPIEGIVEYLHYLENRQIKSALVTNNSKTNTDFLLTKFNLHFDMVITREMQLWKPDPDAFLYVMNIYGSNAEEVISIGDSHYDIRASRAANISAIFIIKNENRGDPLEIENGVTYFKDYYHLINIFESNNLINRKHCRYVKVSTCRHGNIEFSLDKNGKIE